MRKEEISFARIQERAAKEKSPEPYAAMYLIDTPAGFSKFFDDYKGFIAQTWSDLVVRNDPTPVALRNVSMSYRMFEGREPERAHAIKGALRAGISGLELDVEEAHVPGGCSLNMPTNGTRRRGGYIRKE